MTRFSRLLAFIGCIIFSTGVYASPSTYQLGETKALALDKLVKTRNDQPVTVIETPTLYTEAGKNVTGLTSVKISLDASAAVPLIINGKTLNPGSTITVVQDLSKTDGAVKIPYYPAIADVAGHSPYTVELPAITASVCHEGASLDAGDNLCHGQKTYSIIYTCPDNAWTQTGDLTNCLKTTEIPKEVCPEGYFSNNNGTCTLVESASTVPDCPAGYGYNEVSGKCEELLTEPAYKTCADSTYTYNASTNRCEKYVTTSLNHICPSGYTYNPSNKLCEYTDVMAAYKTCATAGYAYNAATDRCEKTLNATASKVCDAGYAYNSTTNRCEKTLSATASKVCESGYAYNSSTDRCEKTLTYTASKVCDAGYTFNASTNRCEKTLTQTASKICTSGFTYNATTDSCLKTTTMTANKTCASGYTYNSGTDSCKKMLTTTASKTCAPGYSYNSTTDSCVKITTTSATKVCANGYTYNVVSDSCLKTTTQTASKVCASGYAYDSATDKCKKVTTTSATKVCASGYTYNSGTDRCLKTTTLAATPTCPSGYTYSSTNKRCEKTNTSDASKVCQSGYSYNSSADRCEKIESTDATPNCPTGYEYSSSDTTCKKQSAAPAVSSCASGYLFNATTKMCEKVTTSSMSLDLSCGDDLLVYEGEWGCYVYDYSMVLTGDDVFNHPCPSGYEYDGLNRNGTEPVYYCKKSNTSSVTPSYSCPSGGMYDGTNCVKIDITSVNWNCPAKYANHNDGTCSALQTASYSFLCPNGYTNLYNGRCAQYLYQPNGYTCPSGYSRTGSMCSKTESVAYSYSCPSGYSRSGSSCSKTEYVAYSYSCPSGYSRSGSTCSKTESVAFSYSCPNGYSLSGSMCSKTVSQAYTYTCGSGYNLSGSTCSKTQYQAYTYTCNSGYSLSGSTCSKTDSQAYTYTCPTDYTLSGSTCSKLVTTNFNYSCTADYTLSGSTCSKLVTASYTYSCPSGYTNHNNGTCTLLVTDSFDWSCPVDYVNHNNGACTKLLTQAYIYKCSNSGYTLNGPQCYQYRSSTPKLTCTDTSYAVNEPKDLCDKTLTQSHIYACTKTNYTLNGSVCNLLLSATADWVCDEPGYVKTNETTCHKSTLFELTGRCPTGWTRNGEACNYKDTAVKVKSCGDNEVLSGGLCAEELLAYPTCDADAIMDGHCGCPSGYALDQAAGACVKVTTQEAKVDCPAGYVDVAGTCTYTKSVAVIYDYCPPGTEDAANNNCSLTFGPPATETCPDKYGLVDGVCIFNEITLAGRTSDGDELGNTYKGSILTELSGMTLSRLEFPERVEEIEGVKPVDVVGGCQVVATPSLAKGATTATNIPCFPVYPTEKNFVADEDGTLSRAHFTTSGTQYLNYELRAFNGAAETEITVAKGAIALNVTPVEAPAINNLRSLMMSNYQEGFEMFNYDPNSKLSSTTVTVEPRTYQQVVTIEDVGTCKVNVGNSFCTIYSSVLVPRDEANLRQDITHKVAANSNNNGWTEAELPPKNWLIHYDYRGPNFVFTEFNSNAASAPVINKALGVDVEVKGGSAVTGINNFRSEVPNDARWWKPSDLTAQFDLVSSVAISNSLEIDGKSYYFEVASAGETSTKIRSLSPQSLDEGATYSYNIGNMPTGTYDVTVTGADTYKNPTVKTYKGVIIKPNTPQVRIFNKGISIEGSRGVPVVSMLDELLVMTHNGVDGSAKIVSVKIDGVDAKTLNSDDAYRKLTGEGYSLTPYEDHELVVVVEDSFGQQITESLPFRYMTTKFGFSRQPSTVIQKVEDIDLSVYRRSGQSCNIYDSKSAATLAASARAHACYIEWTTLPAGVSTNVTTSMAKVNGAVANLGSNTVTYSMYVVNEFGRQNFMSSESVMFESIAPTNIEVALDNNQKVADGLYKVDINANYLARYSGSSSRANVDVTITSKHGEELYKHNQLPFGEIQSFSGYARLIGDLKLWEKTEYKVKAQYRLAPDLYSEQVVDFVVTPNPYMQVIMTLDANRYASTDTIKAKVQLGLKNNSTGLYEYNSATMGDAWDVFIAFKDGTDYEAISNTVVTDANGIANLELDANTIFERNKGIYAVAVAHSPHPEIKIQKVSNVRSLTVVKGTEVEGSLLATRTTARIPATFDIRYQASSYYDSAVLGSIVWQKMDSNDAWVDVPEYEDKQYVSLLSTVPETTRLRAIVTNNTTGVQTTTNTVELVSYDVPDLKLTGATTGIAGQLLTMTATDGYGDTDNTIMQWSLDGQTWEEGPKSFTTAVDSETNRVYGRMKYTSSDLDSNAVWSSAVRYVTIISPRPLTLSIKRPTNAEIGTYIDLELTVSNMFASTGLPVHNIWTMPDGTTLNDQNAVQYLVKAEDLDENKRITVAVEAWVEGFKEATLGGTSSTMSTFEYHFPADTMTLAVNNSVKFVPSTGYAVVNMPSLNAPGVSFTYEWIFDESKITKNSANGRTLSFTVNEAGTHQIKCLVSDNRGNFIYLSGYVEANEPNPLTFDVNNIYSNRYLRAPLNVSLYPNVKVGHPYDFVKTYQWTIDGIPQELSTRAVGNFDSLAPGHYDIKLNVTTNFGQTGEWATTLDVLPNQAPVCTPSVSKTSSVAIVNANCEDPDGVITMYTWVANGIVYTPSGAQMRFALSDFPSASIQIIAEDDASATGEGYISY